MLKSHWKGIICLALAVGGAKAQSSEVKEKPPMYSYIANWTVARDKFKELESMPGRTESLMKKALADGSIVAWGTNDYGQLNVPEPNADFVAVAAGAFHGLGLKADASVVAWGRNDTGACNVPPPNANFIRVGSGVYHSLGIRAGN